MAIFYHDVQTGCSTSSDKNDDDIINKSDDTNEHHHPDTTRNQKMFLKNLDLSKLMKERTDRRRRPKNKTRFPVKLHQLLSGAEKGGYAHIISWDPTGYFFRVHEKDLFVERIMPLFFTQTKFRSFQKQLNLYGFERMIPATPLCYGDSIGNVQNKQRRSSTSVSSSRPMTTTSSRFSSTFLSPAASLGSYYHPKFQRGRQDLCGTITRPSKVQNTTQREKSVKTMHATMTLSRKQHEKEENDHQHHDDENDAETSSKQQTTQPPTEAMVANEMECTADSSTSIVVSNRLEAADDSPSPGAHDDVSLTDHSASRRSSSTSSITTVSSHMDTFFDYSDPLDRPQVEGKDENEPPRSRDTIVESALPELLITPISSPMFPLSHGPTTASNTSTSTIPLGQLGNDDDFRDILSDLLVLLPQEQPPILHDQTAWMTTDPATSMMMDEEGDEEQESNTEKITTTSSTDTTTSSSTQLSPSFMSASSCPNCDKCRMAMQSPFFRQLLQLPSSTDEQ